MARKRLKDRTKELKPIFDKYSNKSNWKKSFTAIVNTKSEAKKLADAIVWFHGTKPKIEEIPVAVRHKEGLIWMRGKSKYRVTSKGYCY